MCVRVMRDRKRNDLVMYMCVNGCVVGILSATPMRPDNLVFYIHLPNGHLSVDLSNTL